MYVEILILGVIIIFTLNYTGRLSTNQFLEDNKTYFLKLKETDWDFYVQSKYGDRVDSDLLFTKRLKNGVLVFLVLLCFFIANMNYVMLLVGLLVGFVVFKMTYFSVRTYYKKHLHTIDLLLPYYLKNLEILIQHYTIPVAIGKSVVDAPEIFKSGLKEMIAKINAGDSSINPYMDFAKQYPVRDSMRMMRLLYRLSLGKQERKQEQLLAFSKTISSLQQKSRETKYKERLDTMEGKTRTMLVVTGVGVMALLLLSLLMMFNM